MTTLKNNKSKKQWFFPLGFPSAPNCNHFLSSEQLLSFQEKWKPVFVRLTGSQERRTKQKQSQTKDQIENVDLFKETNKVNICSRERNVRAVKRQLRCDRDKNKKEHKNSIFVEGNKDKIKSGRDKINIRKNRKRENNTRGKIQQRKGKEREKEQ